ncbi:MAG: BtrH N-terminal domain-containing protein, partial [Chloroflexi bacterium]|nr:BtrH N-terminal domain-containing protein [Chloroflexota bacterium]
MPTLANFTQFAGSYWDTGSIRNALDYQGAIAPHTGEPYDEALLLGISGGITFGYFTFHYQGYDPQVNLLTRNTFDPMGRICERLGIEVKLLRTASLERMRKNLINTLEAGQAPIAKPDMYLLDYNCLEADSATWGTMPLVVFGYEPGGDVLLSDRSSQPLTVAADDFDRAMSRVKKDRHGLTLLGEPDEDRLPEAIRAGLRDTVGLMLEKPPKGSARNFGVKALEHWQTALGGKGKGSWAKEYARGRACLAAHTSA